MQELLQAYINTNFKVYDPCLIINIGVANHQLDDLLLSFNATTWAYITAYNPYSKLLTDEENQERHIKLKDKLGDFKIFEGECKLPLKLCHYGLEFSGFSNTLSTKRRPSIWKGFPFAVCG